MYLAPPLKLLVEVLIVPVLAELSMPEGSLILSVPIEVNTNAPLPDTKYEPQSRVPLTVKLRDAAIDKLLLSVRDFEELTAYEIYVLVNTPLFVKVELLPLNNIVA